MENGRGHRDRGRRRDFDDDFGGGGRDYGGGGGRDYGGGGYGGGGYGSPLNRPADDVAADAKQGYISLASVKELYGVVLDRESFAVDVAATQRLRAAMQQAQAASRSAAG